MVRLTQIAKVKGYGRRSRGGYAAKKLNADGILRLLITPLDLSWYRGRSTFLGNDWDKVTFDPYRHAYGREQYIARHATTGAIVNVLQRVTSPADKRLLLHVLGRYGTTVALLAVSTFLSDRSPTVQGEAGYAIRNIALANRTSLHGSNSFADKRAQVANQRLLERFSRERKLRTCSTWIPDALGALGYPEAIPVLIETLIHTETWMRLCAVGWLEEMNATEACKTLMKALPLEAEAIVAARMRMAIERLQCSENAK